MFRNQLRSALPPDAEAPPAPVTPTDVATSLQLGAALVEEWEEIQRHHHAFTEKLRAFDLAHGHAAFGALTVNAWLRTNCRMTGAQAQQQLMVSRRLTHLPETERAFSRGDISYQSCAVIASCARRLGDGVVREQEATLVEAATHLDSHRLRMVTAHLEHIVDPDGSLGFWERLRERRFIDMSQGADGTYSLRGFLDPESGAIVATAIDSLITPPRPGDSRNYGQRRADALVDIANRHLADSDRPVRGKERPVLTLLAEIGTLRRQPNSPGGEFLQGITVIPADVISRYACDCTVHRARRDAFGREVDVVVEGRVIPRSLWRQLVLRDRGCVFNGCGRPAAWCDGHHIIPREEGGPTVLSNLCLTCRRHHVLLHEGGWRILRSDSGAFVTLRPGEALAAGP